MTDKDRDLTPQGNAPSWVDEVLASSSPAAPRPVEGRHGPVSDAAPDSAGRTASGWEDWPPSPSTSGHTAPGYGASGHGASGYSDPARDLRLPEDPPRPVAPPPAAARTDSPRFDADDWVARATGGQVRDPRVGGAPTRTTTTTYAAAPQTDAWGEPLRSGPVPGSPASPVALPLREDIGQKKLVAGLLGIFLGSLGVHKFYLGQNTAGLLMLAVNLGVWALAIVLSLLTLGFGAVVLFPLAGFVSSVLGVVGLIEGIIYLTKSDADFQRDYLYGKKAWF
ncbi:TM2 domain-containing protein [Deinococcus wulumuqiensis]|uniref:TM2 domain-containing protein n=3 Tax=Deinococcus wulumuqiensis TaxID=980427 RepID=A0AAV4K484_9DEIO|nr:TM2 domain-containing protein [Deinococcus wulumuqiensis]QII21573.1 TM2 domain-containing protein [Deinococcus wulumuqiensis R12]GGI83774.1 hypothetical protein GCM10010914_17680 [Deinococcus wulumuqiensis]GGP29704.1 hypothetical protein GCM10008021_13550 [Deinococcus wulumuqiensis]